MSDATSTEQIDGRKVTLHVDLKSGRWSAVYENEYVAHADTRADVIQKARLALRRRKVRLSIPATIVNVDGTRKPLHVIITGLHAQNGDILYETVTGKKTKGRLSRYSDELCARLTNDELVNFGELRRVAQHATGALEKWQKAHVIEDKEQFVKDAIEEQVEKDG